MKKEKIADLVDKLAYEVEIRGTDIANFNRTIDLIKKEGFKVTKSGKDTYRIYNKKQSTGKGYRDGWNVFNELKDLIGTDKYTPKVFSNYCILSYPDSVNGNLKFIKGN